jgi:hypothetical protein
MTRHLPQKLKDLAALFVMGSWSDVNVVCECGHDGGCHGCPVPTCDSCGALECLVCGCLCLQMSHRRYEWRKYFAGVVHRMRRYVHTVAFRTAGNYRFHSIRLREILLDREREICDDLKAKYTFEADWAAGKFAELDAEMDDRA